VVGVSVGEDVGVAVGATRVEAAVGVLDAPARIVALDVGVEEDTSVEVFAGGVVSRAVGASVALTAADGSLESPAAPAGTAVFVGVLDSTSMVGDLAMAVLVGVAEETAAAEAAPPSTR
jgi:hypothetical protein